MTKRHDDHSTRDRVLEAAGSLFAEKGFEGATIRDICEAAGANVASVNYHFRDKETLYAEAVERALRARTELAPLDGGLAPDAPADQRLKEFVRAFLKRRFDRASPHWWGRLIARAMRRPRDAVRPAVEKSKRDNWQHLTSIIVVLLGKGADQATVELCASSVFGQVFHYFHGHHRDAHVSASDSMADRKLDETAEHIASFSLGGIARVRGTIRRRKA